MSIVGKEITGVLDRLEMLRKCWDEETLELFDFMVDELKHSNRHIKFEHNEKLDLRLKGQHLKTKGCFRYNKADDTFFKCLNKISAARVEYADDDRFMQIYLVPYFDINDDLVTVNFSPELTICLLAEGIGEE